MINGTQLITSIGAEAVERAGIIARQADVVAALTLEVLKGSSRAFDPGNWTQVLLLLFLLHSIPYKTVTD
jgi:histidine ammonia-lyase